MGPSIIDGKLMGLPVASSARAMLVNMDLLNKVGAQPPKTWNQLYDVAQKLSTIPGDFGFGLQGKQIETDSYFYYILWSFGGELFTKDGKSGLDSPQAIAAATFYEKLLDNHVTEPEPTDYSREDVFNLFKQGKVGMVFTFPMLVPQLKAEAPNLHYAVLPFPVEKQKATLGVTDSLVIFSASHQKKLAADFIQFMYQEKYRSQFDRKGAVIMFTKSIAVDLIRHNIRVNALCPGITRTPRLQAEVDNSVDPAATAAAQATWAPIMRVADAREIAHGALFLASDDSSFAVGSCLVLDGGFTAR
jgi:multiple sugar transport system substrate-binding protein